MPNFSVKSIQLDNSCRLSILNVVDEQDTPTLTVPQATEVLKAAKRIALGNIKFDDIVELESMPGYFRWKPSKEMRHTCDCEIRMVFRYIRGGVEIIAARKRTDDFYSRIVAGRIRQYVR
jgi:hypothetical protein